MPRPADQDFRTWWAQQTMLTGCYKTSATLDPAEEMGFWEDVVVKSMMAGEERNERNLTFEMTDATIVIVVMNSG